jgi:hypothetical protein
VGHCHIYQYMTIICKTCKHPLPETDFWKQPQNKSGYESSCKKCRMGRKYERRRERRLEQGLTVKFPTLANRQLMEEGKKYCPGCKQILDLTEFSTMNVRNGIASHCKECVRLFGKNYNKTPKGKQKRKETYRKNRERWINNKLKKRFGITYDQYKIILLSQGNKCAICGRTPEENKKMLAVDHNHTTGKNRGLLCSSCNICIGFIEKNNLSTDSLCQYLAKHNA